MAKLELRISRLSCYVQLNSGFCLRMHLLKLERALPLCTGRATLTHVAAQLSDTMPYACANAGPGMPRRSKRLGNSRCKLADGSLVLVTKHKLGTCILHGLPGKSSSRQMLPKHSALHGGQQSLR